MNARTLLTGLTAGALLAASGLAPAQPAAYPTKSIRMIAPYPPGGGVDLACRVVGQKLTERWGQQVIVDNRGGANGNIGAELAARSAADGYTLLMGAAGPITMNKWLYQKLPFDPVRDFAPVVLVAPTYYLLVVHPSMPTKSVKELIALARSSPGKLTFASPGIGGPPHLATELLKSLTGADMVHVPYKGAGPAISDLLGGQVSFMFADMIAVLPHVEAGKLRALAISTAGRNARVPKVPTVAESGAPGFEVLGWSGILAPAGTPRVVIDKLNAEVRAILKLPDVQQKLASDASDFGKNAPEQFAAFIRRELAKWEKVIKASGARAE
ncbi:MAG: tripartite tricarboxylate transporter substrate binding protein [Betaproteobacteria bacterium]|nr:tripartite tricarboxylate transporter substrate binding protein [Betaproteobacteria bacterium]